VDGGLPFAVNIPITAVVKEGDKTETVPIGEISTLKTPSTFLVPYGTTQVLVSGKPVNLSGPVTWVNMAVKTAPSKFGDFLWAFGAPRNYNIQTISVAKGGGPPLPKLPRLLDPDKK
jgi:hypothetical protein